MYWQTAPGYAACTNQRRACVLACQRNIQAVPSEKPAGIEDVQAYIRNPTVPTMADAGVLANVAIHEGGHAQGTLGQASRLRDLVRSMTPTKVLGEVGIGAVFGGGRLLVGEGEQQDSLKVVALTPLRVAAVPAEQLAIESPGNIVEELRNYMAFQLTYWLSRCNMISKHVRRRLRCADAGL